MNIEAARRRDAVIRWRRAIADGLTSRAAARAVGVPRALKVNTLRKGIAEARMQQTLARVYPRIDVLTARMYRDALAAGPAGHIFDLSHIFDQTAQPFILDHVHLNEAGNRIAAEQAAPIVSARLPESQPLK